MKKKIIILIHFVTKCSFRHNLNHTSIRKTSFAKVDTLPSLIKKMYKQAIILNKLVTKCSFKHISKNFFSNSRQSSLTYQENVKSHNLSHLQDRGLQILQSLVISNWTADLGPPVSVCKQHSTEIRSNTAPCLSVIVLLVC